MCSWKKWLEGYSQYIYDSCSEVVGLWVISNFSFYSHNFLYLGKLLLINVIWVNWHTLENNLLTSTVIYSPFTRITISETISLFPWTLNLKMLLWFSWSVNYEIIPDLVGFWWHTAYYAIIEAIQKVFLHLNPFQVMWLCNCHCSCSSQNVKYKRSFMGQNR